MAQETEIKEFISNELTSIVVNMESYPKGILADNMFNRIISRSIICFFLCLLEISAFS